MMTVMQNLGTFAQYVLIAAFVQNAVFTRGFGVSRLVKLVGDSAVDSMIFCALLTLVQVISAPMAYYANRLLASPQYWYRSYLWPLVCIICALLAFFIVLAFITLVRPRNYKEIIAVLPMATLNTAVLGPMLISAVQSYNFAQTIGFALGSGVGYTLAVLIVTEGQHKLNSRKIPGTFRGLPINFLYIGILVLAFYGLTGHRIAI